MPRKWRKKAIYCDWCHKEIKTNVAKIVDEDGDIYGYYHPSCARQVAHWLELKIEGASKPKKIKKIKKTKPSAKSRKLKVSVKGEIKYGR